MSGDDTSDLDAGLPPSTGAGTGDDADVEDSTDLPPATPVPPDMYELRQKLRRSAHNWAPITPCKLQDDCKDAKKNRETPTTIDRLSARPKTALDMVEDTIDRPKGVVPPLALPHWHTLRLDKKIPLLPAPAGFMYYTAGKLGQKLTRLPKLYSLNDPHNRERIVGFPYSILSDPHTKSFVNKRMKKEALQKQGFINENNEIMISLREFNKYRDYLRTLHADEVNQSLQKADELYKKEREQIQRIRQEMSADIGASAAQQKRIAESRRIQTLSANHKADRLLRKHEQTEARLQNWAKEKERICMERLLRKAQKQRLQAERLEAVKKARTMETRKKLQHFILKDLRSIEKKAQDMEMIKKANEIYLMEWIDMKITQSEARVEKEENISRAWRAHMKARAKIRQRRMEAMRNDLPNSIERKKKEEARLLDVARKYFWIWLNKVREMKASQNQDNSEHANVWASGGNTLKKTVTYLQFQTDTHAGKLDDFIASIMRWKSAIMRQIKLEEGWSDNESDGGGRSVSSKHSMLMPILALKTVVSHKAGQDSDDDDDD